MTLLETSGKHKACPDDSARPGGDRYGPRLLKQYIGMLLMSSPGLADRGFSPQRRWVSCFVESRLPWFRFRFGLDLLSTGFETFPLAQREVSLFARDLNVGFQFKSRVRGVQRANT